MIFEISRLKERYRAFLETVGRCERVWVLLSPAGRGAVFDSLHAGVNGRPLDVELVFSSPARLREVAQANEAWSGWAARELSLPQYLAALAQFHDRLVAPDPTANGGALEIVPEFLAAAITARAEGRPIDLRSVTEIGDAVAQFEGALRAGFPMSSEDGLRQLHLVELTRSGDVAAGEVHAVVRLVAFERGEIVDVVEQEVFVVRCNEIWSQGAPPALDAILQYVRKRLSSSPQARPFELFPAYADDTESGCKQVP